MVTARASVHEDRLAATDLAHAARALIVDERGGTAFLEALGDAERVGDRCGKRLPDVVVVGEVGGYVLGYAFLSVAGHVGVIAELFVAPDARGVGLGHVLLADSLSKMREAGCTRADTSALPGDRATKNFFEAHGLVTRLLTPSRAL